MNLSQANKKMAIQQATEQALKEMREIIDKGLSLQMESVMLLVLHDKFGFGAERCKKALLGFEELWDSINKNYCSLDDISKTLDDEVGLYVDFEKCEMYMKKPKKGDEN